jgi:hypothetical protein
MLNELYCIRRSIVPQSDANDSEHRNAICNPEAQAPTMTCYGVESRRNQDSYVSCLKESCCIAQYEGAATQSWT